LQNPVVVSPVVRLVFLPAPAVNSADVDDEAMAAIGQRDMPVIDNHIADSKSSPNTPPSPTSLGSRGNRNNWDAVYGLKNLLFCHHLQSYTGCFSYNSLAYSSHCFIVYICWVLVQAPEPVPVVQTPELVAVVQTPVSVPVEAMPAELPRDLQNPVVVSPVV
jgi:hypothetical protein